MVTITPRQREILALLWEGLSEKEVADRLQIHPNTVYFHRYKLQARFHCVNKVQLLKAALDAGLLSPTPAL